MTSQLFRIEAINARNTRWAGAIVLLQPVPIKLAGAISAFLVVAVCAYMYTAEYTRKIRVTGQIVAARGVVKTVSPQFARIVSRHIEEGQVISAGQVMFEMASDRKSENTDVDSTIDASLRARRELLVREERVQADQLSGRRRALEQRNQLMIAEIARLDQEIGFQQTRVANAERMLRRYRILNTSGYVSEFHLAQYENEYADQLARNQVLARSKIVATRDLAQSEYESKQIIGQIELSEAQAARALAALDQEAIEHRARSRFQVVAPVTGVATAITGQPGQSVAASASLATIIPQEAGLEAHLLAPSKAIGFVETGQTVLLRINAFPYQKFGQVRGTVIAVDQSPVLDVAPISNSVSREESGDPLYRVAVKLERESLLGYGKSQKFKVGMTLEADIRQERRRLARWVIDPLLNIVQDRPVDSF